MARSLQGDPVNSSCRLANRLVGASETRLRGIDIVPETICADEKSQS
jgi:hypothetical protein